MVHPAVLVFLVVMYALLCTVVFWWVRWLRSESRFPDPFWRSVLALMSFGLASLSVLILLVSVLHSHLRGGFEHYDPLLMLYMRSGFFSAFAGFLVAPFGKGYLRWKALLLSLAMMLIWIGLAMGE